MGRGRKGIINQGTKNLVFNRKHDIAKFFDSRAKSDETKIFVPEQAFDFKKNMNSQQLVDFLLPKDDDWHVKTSSRNAE